MKVRILFRSGALHELTVTPEVGKKLVAQVHLLTSKIGSTEAKATITAEDLVLRVDQIDIIETLP